MYHFHLPRMKHDLKTEEYFCWIFICHKNESWYIPVCQDSHFTCQHHHLQAQAPQPVNFYCEVERDEHDDDANFADIDIIDDNSEHFEDIIDDHSCASSLVSSESLSTCPGMSWVIKYIMIMTPKVIFRKIWDFFPTGLTPLPPTSGFPKRKK